MPNTVNSKTPKPQQSSLPLHKLPYFDIKRQHDPLLSGTLAAFEKIFSSGAYILGPALKDFECKFASYIGVPYAAGVGSGTDALIFGLKAEGVKAGDEVIVPSFTFTATALAALHLRAVPVFADVDPVSFTLDPQSVLKAISKKTKAMIPVHLFGQCANMDALTAIAKTKKIKVIEDACQAHGAVYKGRRVGGLSDAGCFSFYPTKNLGALGDGGCIVTNDRDLAERLRMLRNYGQRGKYEHECIGINSRLDEIQAAVLREKLPFLEKWNHQRRRVAQAYREGLEKTDLILPEEIEYAHHVYHLYVIRSGDRNRLAAHFSHCGIQTSIHYPIPVHRQKAYQSDGVPKSLPMTDLVSDEILSLPMHPWLEEGEIDKVIDAGRSW